MKQSNNYLKTKGPLREIRSIEDDESIERWGYVGADTIPKAIQIAFIEGKIAQIESTPDTCSEDAIKLQHEINSIINES